MDGPLRKLVDNLGTAVGVPLAAALLVRTAAGRAPG
jgi:hypothetical protein